MIFALCGLPALAAPSEFGTLYPRPVERTGPMDAGPAGVLSADLDRDGNLDLAVCVFEEGKVMVLLGNGDGTLDEIASYPVPGPSFLALGDFDDDGNEDLAVANLTDGDLSILMGHGDGTFDPEVRYGNPAGQGWRVAVGDFNEDDKQDIVMSSPNGNSLFPGNGDGTFGTEISVPGASQSVVVGDFNEDGLDDFAEPSQVLLGDGNFGFSVVDDLASSVGISHIATADLDGDDDLDLAVAYGDDWVSVFLGHGDGTFAPQETYTVLGVTHVQMLDLNEDVIPDLVTYSFWGAGGVNVLIGSGGGQFNDPVHINTGDVAGYSLTGGDFNHDGHQDIALGDFIFSHVGVVLGRGDGTFELAIELPMSPDGRIVDVADLNLDGRDDVVNISGNIRIALANGAGTFDVTDIASPGSAPKDLVVAEVTGDGLPDLALFDFVADAVYVLNGDGSGLFVHDLSLPVVNPVRIEAADLNGDQIDDLIVSSDSGRLYVFLGQVAAGFESKPLVAVGASPQGIAVGRIDADPHPDLAVATLGGGVSLRLGQGDGTFLLAPSVSAIDDPYDVALGDLDGDSILDLAVANDGTEVVQILRGNGDATFTPVGVLTSESGARRVSVADLNGDSTLDLMASLNGATLFPGKGDGAFGPGQSFISGANVVAGDFDLDDRTDLATALGTLLLNKSGPDAFTFMPDRITLVWPSELGARSYTVYRGLLSGLVDSDADGLPDGGYGNCISTLDDDDRDTFFVDADVPSPGGTAFFYLVGVVDDIGEHGLGTTSAGLPRVPQTPCP